MLTWAKNASPGYSLKTMTNKIPEAGPGRISGAESMIQSMWATPAHRWQGKNEFERRAFFRHLLQV
jgi:hypothetical protein